MGQLAIIIDNNAIISKFVVEIILTIVYTDSIMNRKQQKSFLVTGFISIILFCAISSAFSQARVLKIATVAPANSVWDVEEKKLAQAWTKVTDNTVQMKFMSSNAMGGESSVIQKLNSVRPGQRAPIDGALFTNLGVANLAPETYFLTLALPFLFDNQEELDYVIDQLADTFNAAMSKKGYVALGYFNVGWSYFFTKKPARTPAELKSQKLSVAGVGLNELSNAFKVAGFNTIDVSTEKLLQSIKTPGGAEGFYTIPMYAYAGQYYKSLPYILDIGVFPVTAALVLSQKTWSEIPDKYKTAMLKEVQATRRQFAISQKNSDREYIERCVAGGCNLVTLTDEERKNFIDTLRSDIPAMVQTGLVDPSMFSNVQKLLEKYRNK